MENGDQERTKRLEGEVRKLRRQVRRAQAADPWTCVLFALAFPGMGHAHAGAALRMFAWLAAYVVVPVVALWASGWNLFAPLWALAAVHAAQAADAFVAATQRR